MRSIQLDSLDTLGAELVIGANDELATLNGLPALKGSGTFLITNNPKLPQCELDGIVGRIGVDCSPCIGNDTTTHCE